MGAAMGALEQVDPEVAAMIRHEEQRQQTVLEMIPSENYASAAVMEAVGSVLTNKYAEGYPGARYYHGNANVDEVENIARQRATAPPARGRWCSCPGSCRPPARTAATA